jgi:hypothetical protein
LDPHSNNENCCESNCALKPNTNSITVSSSSNKPDSDKDKSGTKYFSTDLNTWDQFNKYTNPYVSPSRSYGADTGNQYTSTQSIATSN